MTIAQYLERSDSREPKQPTITHDVSARSLMENEDATCLIAFRRDGSMVAYNLPAKKATS